MYDITFQCKSRGVSIPWSENRFYDFRKTDDEIWKIASDDAEGLRKSLSLEKCEVILIKETIIRYVR